jgi:predicted  nucleic acid-binding Zn-ribbon protein
MGSNIFHKSEILHLRIATIKQRIQKLETDKIENDFFSTDEKELSQLNAKLEVLTHRLSEVHQQILDFSVRIKSDNERYIVIEYFVNHTSRAVIVNNFFYDRSGVYKIIKKYENM